MVEKSNSITTYFWQLAVTLDALEGEVVSARTVNGSGDGRVIRAFLTMLSFQKRVVNHDEEAQGVYYMSHLGSCTCVAGCPWKQLLLR